MTNQAEWTAHDVAALREALGDTQMEFAHRLRVHYMTVIGWEAGKHKPSRLAVVLLDKVKEAQCQTSE